MTILTSLGWSTGREFGVATEAWNSAHRASRVLTKTYQTVMKERYDDSSGGEVTPRSVSRPIPGRPVPGRGRRTRNRQNRSRLELATEQSPLLRKEPSRSSIVRQYTQGPVDDLSVVDTQAGELDEGGDTQGQKTLQLRRKSSAISKVEKEFVPGRSTFGQTVSIFYTCTLL